MRRGRLKRREVCARGTGESNGTAAGAISGFEPDAVGSEAAGAIGAKGTGAMGTGVGAAV